eukprot:10178326-Ditylum_brightwellii.AAC.2
MVWESITLGSVRKSFVITMVFVTMAPKSATLFKLTENISSLLIVLRNNRGSGRSGMLRTLKGMPRNMA